MLATYEALVADMLVSVSRSLMTHASFHCLLCLFMSACMAASHAALLPPLRYGRQL